MKLSNVIDISCVKPGHTAKDIDQMADAARKYKFVCAFALPGMTPFLIEKLKGSGTMAGGP